MILLLYFISSLELNSYCARISLGKGEVDVRTETFRSDPAGTQSCPVERGEQPEASLAWAGVIQFVKRRQRS